MHFGGQKENYVDFTGAQVSSEPQKGSGSSQTPVCWDKEQLGVLRAAPVMPTALDNAPVPPQPQQQPPAPWAALGRHRVPDLLQSPCHAQLG